ncbi:glycosyl hydrolase 115 family protein, partial [Listeria monocytogenes]|nr:glycosyl hydrolase 115 family protein [Listeria monocytogenes]
SHHEPMMRAHDEWARFGKGPWDYGKNADVLQAFWKQGLHNSHGQDRVITLGMRGDGDEPMSEEDNVDLLQKIVRDQRALIEQDTGKPASEVPQVWALYKEVQGYY